MSIARNQIAPAPEPALRPSAPVPGPSGEAEPLNPDDSASKYQVDHIETPLSPPRRLAPLAANLASRDELPVTDATASMCAQLSSMSLGTDGSGIATIALSGFTLNAHGANTLRELPPAAANNSTESKQARLNKKSKLHQQTKKQGILATIWASTSTIFISLATVFVVVFITAAFFAVFEGDTELLDIEEQACLGTQHGECLPLRIVFPHKNMLRENMLTFTWSFTTNRCCTGCKVRCSTGHASQI